MKWRRMNLLMRMLNACILTYGSGRVRFIREVYRISWGLCDMFATLVLCVLAAQLQSVLSVMLLMF